MFPARSHQQKRREGPSRVARSPVRSLAPASAASRVDSFRSLHFHPCALSRSFSISLSSATTRTGLVLTSGTIYYRRAAPTSRAIVISPSTSCTYHGNAAEEGGERRHVVLETSDMIRSSKSVAPCKRCSSATLPLSSSRVGSPPLALSLALSLSPYVLRRCSRLLGPLCSRRIKTRARDVAVVSCRLQHVPRRSVLRRTRGGGILQRGIGSRGFLFLSVYTQARCSHTTFGTHLFSISMTRWFSLALMVARAFSGILERGERTRATRGSF